MNISQSSDDSKHSKKMVTEFEERFSAKITEQIISASERFLSIMKAHRTRDSFSEIDAIDMMNTDQLMGSKFEQNDRGDNYSLQPAINAVEDAALTVCKKNAKFTLSPSEIEGSPERIVMAAIKNI